MAKEKRVSVPTLGQCKAEKTRRERMEVATHLKAKITETNNAAEAESWARALREYARACLVIKGIEAQG